MSDVVLSLADTSGFTVDVAGSWPGPVKKFDRVFANFYRILNMYTHDGFAYPFNDGDVAAFLVSGTPVTVHGVEDPEGLVRKLDTVFKGAIVASVVETV